MKLSTYPSAAVLLIASTLLAPAVYAVPSADGVTAGISAELIPREGSSVSSDDSSDSKLPPGGNEADWRTPELHKTHTFWKGMVMSRKTVKEIEAYVEQEHNTWKQGLEEMDQKSHASGKSSSSWWPASRKKLSEKMETMNMHLEAEMKSLRADLVLIQSEKESLQENLDHCHLQLRDQATRRKRPSGVQRRPVAPA